MARSRKLLLKFEVYRQANGEIISNAYGDYFHRLPKNHKAKVEIAFAILVSALTGQDRVIEKVK